MSSETHHNILADNRRARFEYDILETLEAGIVLLGTEIKSMRQSRPSLKEAYAAPHADEMMLYNMHIAPCTHAHHKMQHEPRRGRKLLLKRREINKIAGLARKEGITLIPLKLFLNGRGIAKLQLGLSRGRKKADKRAAIKQREWNVEQGRLLKNRHQ